jgi:pimeloyl-ACP methyl ester carboxylesterase
MVNVLNMKKIVFLSLIALLSACSFQQSVPSVTTFDELAYPFAVQKVTLDNGMEIAYMDEGRGEQTLLFIHGLGSYAPAWKKNISSLSQSARCIAIDLPGYGKSSKGKYEASMSAFADVVQNFIEKLNLEKVTLVGHSMGGQISIMTALAYPDQIDQLILVAPAGFETFTPGQKQWFREVLTPRAVRLTSVDQIKSNIGWNFHDMPDDAFFMVSDRIAMRKAEGFGAYCYIIPECVRGMVDQPVFDYLNRIQQKTLVIFGENDNLIPNRFLNGGETADYARKGAEQIPNCQLEILSKAGHFVQFEKADRVNELIQGFLKN